MARRLAHLLGSAHIELDALFWQPNWTETPRETFRDKVRAAIDRERWVVDGNYGAIRDIVWPHATHLVWLNYSYWLVVWRALSRTLRRVASGEVMWAGNRESFGKAFFSSDSIIWWAASTYHRRLRTYRRLFDEQTYPQLQVYELRSQPEADWFVRELETATDPSPG